MSTSALMNNYGQRSTTLTKGEGAYLWDDQDNVYLDALSGIAVCGLGHSHDKVTSAICEQAATLLHVSNLFNIPPQQTLADRLRQVSGLDNVFFSNSGAEANEAAIKIARKYGHEKGIDLPSIIVMEQSFHGRTMATLTATGNEKIQQGFEPLLEGFIRAPYNDIAAVRRIAENTSNVVAVLVEPVQGEGGVNVPEKDYLNQLRHICDEHDWLLMLDEIQTGNGRTGKFFSFQHNDIQPDVVTTAKGLGNGLPIGACLAKGKAAVIFQPGNHGSTFGGNPLACQGAIAVIDTLINEDLIKRAEQLGNYFLSSFQHSLRDCDSVLDIRGQGLMIGIELNRPCAELVEAAKQNGLIINVTAGNTVRLLPPLIITDEQAETIVAKVTEIVRAF